MGYLFAVSICPERDRENEAQTGGKIDPEAGTGDRARDVSAIESFVKLNLISGVCLDFSRMLRVFLGVFTVSTCYLLRSKPFIYDKPLRDYQDWCADNVFASVENRPEDARETLH